MTARVLLLRGINVGGRNSLPMSDLRTVLEDLGARDVATYIQSGNAVFRGDVSSDAVTVGIEARAGFRPQALVLTAAAFRAVADANPYPDAAAADGKAVHVFFCDGAPRDPDGATRALATETEDVTVTGNAAYLLAPEGIGRSKLAARLERLLGVPATARNWKTVTALAGMLDALG
ncbi:DUF1697 domain-containing protein [Rhodobacterales bacterium HKCCE2091]|nr:DUF1697 domain-containing protein [Rhodobacterales bacterium HKCCE2091]